MRSRIRYALWSPRTPERIAQHISGGLAVAISGGVVALLASGAPSHWFAAGLVAAADTLAGAA